MFVVNKIRINREVVRTIEELAMKSTMTETGGIIAGTGRFSAGNIVITKCSDSGEKAVKKRYLFSRDSKYCQDVLDKWAENSNGRIDYLGEWHKHFELSPKPSSTDLKTMRSIDSSDSYHVEKCIMIIIGLKNNIKMFVTRGLGYTELNWEVLD